jgi:hypothetical protein
MFHCVDATDYLTANDNFQPVSFQTEPDSSGRQIENSSGRSERGPRRPSGRDASRLFGSAQLGELIARIVVIRSRLALQRARLGTGTCIYIHIYMYIYVCVCRQASFVLAERKGRRCCFADETRRRRVTRGLQNPDAPLIRRRRWHSQTRPAQSGGAGAAAFVPKLKIGSGGSQKGPSARRRRRPADAKREPQAARLPAAH